MPVTAKLSRGFYDRLGDEIANELVEWFNNVDATYRSDLREMNELNFVRFDAKLERQFAEFEVRFAEIEAKIERRLADFEAQIERRLNEFEVNAERRFVALEKRFEGLETQIGERFGKLEARMARWMLGAFLAQAGLIYALLRAR